MVGVVGCLCFSSHEYASGLCHAGIDEALFCRADTGYLFGKQPREELACSAASYGRRPARRPSARAWLTILTKCQQQSWLLPRRWRQRSRKVCEGLSCLPLSDTVVSACQTGRFKHDATGFARMVSGPVRTSRHALLGWKPVDRRRVRGANTEAAHLALDLGRHGGAISWRLRNTHRDRIGSKPRQEQTRRAQRAVEAP